MIQNLIDTHFHLDYYKNHQEVYTGINKMRQYTLCMTNSPGIYASCKRMYQETKYLKFALGFHPQEASLTERDFISFIHLVDQTNYVGEVGLDFSKSSYLSQSRQYDYFEKIVKICAEKNKLMSIHLRKSEEVAISILKDFYPHKCIVHWFTGTNEQMELLLELGCYFSINSNMVNNGKCCEKLKLVPESRILIESDGPFTKIRGRKYTFDALYDVYEQVAQFYNSPDLIKTVYSNFRKLLLQ